jgi:hypothetical protein
MKKQLIIAAMAMAVSLNAFAQGYVNFQNTTHSVYDGFTTPATPAQAPGNVYVGFLWGTGASLIGNAGSPNTANSTSSQANWTALLNDPSYQVASNFTGGAILDALVTSGLGKGNYNFGASVGVAGMAANTAYNIIVFAWASSAGANPFAAASSGAALGWTSTFSYTTGTSISTLPNFSNGAFGVNVIPVPEPTTIALASLGGLSLLAFRRRNKA